MVVFLEHGEERGASTETPPKLIILIILCFEPLYKHVTWNHKGWWSLSCICIYIYTYICVTHMGDLPWPMPSLYILYNCIIMYTLGLWRYEDRMVFPWVYVCIYIYFYMYMRISIHTLEWINKTRWKATKNVDGWLGALVIAVMDCLCPKKIQGWIHTCSMCIYIYTHRVHDWDYLISLSDN